MNDLLSVQGLGKDYAQFTLKDVSFSIPGGAIMGFIGPNGAGKTTTIKSILGMIRRSRGSIRLFGQEVDQLDPHLREQIGVVMDAPFYVDDWRVSEVEKALSPFYQHWDRAAFQQSLEEFGLDARKRVKELSRGMKVKLMLAVALSHGAKLLILDEPTSGLDPVARDELMDILRSFVCDEQHAILFSTHITSDLEKIADYITFLQKGELMYSGETDRLMEQYVRVSGGTEELTSALRGRLHGLRQHSVGFEGMLSCEDLSLIPPHAVTEALKLEDIMVFMNKEGAHHE